MDITDGETIGGDGLPGPASRKLQGTNAEKRKAGKRKAETGNLPVGHLTPNQLAATQQYLQTQFKSLATAIIVFLAGEMACVGSAHLEQHNNDGSHKTVQVQTGGRREENSGQVLPDGPSSGGQGAEGGAKGTSNIQHPTPNIQAEGGAVEQMHQMLLGFQQRLTEIRSEMRRGFASVLVEHQELKSAKERLEQMQGENLFKFLLEIDDRAFRIICAVLVTGDVAKAARALRMKDSTLRQVLTRWRRRGGVYLGLLELVRWRKRRRITGTVPFNDALLYDDGGKSSRESVMAEVLDGVLSMTEANWPDVCAELETLLRGQLGSLRTGTARR